EHYCIVGRLPFPQAVFCTSRSSTQPFANQSSETERHGQLLQVVPSEQPSLCAAGDAGIARSDPQTQMPKLSPQHFTGWNYKRSESNECQQKDHLSMDRERTRDHVPNSERPTT